LKQKIVKFFDNFFEFLDFVVDIAEVVVELVA